MKKCNKIQKLEAKFKKMTYKIIKFLIIIKISQNKNNNYNQNEWFKIMITINQL